MSKAKAVESRRYSLGVVVSGSGRFPNCHMLYEVLMSDGTSKLERGKSIHVIPTLACLNGTKASKAKAMETCRPDLRSHIEAISLLQKELEYACLRADGQLKER